MKWGDEAAEYRLLMRRYALALGVPALLFLIVALVLPVKDSVRLGLLVVGVLCGMALLLAVLLLGRRMNRAASKTLGIRIGWKADDSPPARSPAYESWCETKGIKPYSASRRYSS
jgi:hypothetical protein